MECAAKGRGTRCIGPARRRCGRCGAVAYCSVSHQISHWNDHKGECERLEQQMKCVDVLNNFPFTFSEEATVQVCEKRESRCSFFSKRGIHRVGMWMAECSCGLSAASFDRSRSNNDGWDLPSIMCPCSGPSSPLSKHLCSWKDYYEWRNIPLDSPVALLLHWPLTIYYASLVAGFGSFNSEINNKFCIHYLGYEAISSICPCTYRINTVPNSVNSLTFLAEMKISIVWLNDLSFSGPEKELLQLAVFGELCALFPGVQVHMDLIGPEIPPHRDGENIDLCSYAHCFDSDCMCKSSSEKFSWSACTVRSSSVTLQLHRGFYHDRYRDIAKDSFPHLVIAPNAGIAAYSSWSSTIELIKETNVLAIFSDYCEQACHLAASCIGTITGCPPRFPIQLNPFRQPLVVEDTALYLPCYSNCFLFGM